MGEVQLLQGRGIDSGHIELGEHVVAEIEILEVHIGCWQPYHGERTVAYNILQLVLAFSIFRLLHSERSRSVSSLLYAE